jgi:predicted PurR-regulated permease PerM
MIPAVLVTLSTPITTLATIALYFLIQQFENSIVVPKVMQRATGVRPLVTITLLMVGFKIAGGVGAILAIPAYLTLKVSLEEFLFK